MSDEVKILDSYEFKKLNVAFADKVENLNDELRDAIDDELQDDKLVSLINSAKDILDEYLSTAESLKQYGSGIKQEQFLEDHESDIGLLKKKIDAANEIIRNRK